MYVFNASMCPVRVNTVQNICTKTLQIHAPESAENVSNTNIHIYTVYAFQGDRLPQYPMLISQVPTCKIIIF